jgi:hypothetical protein
MDIFAKPLSGWSVLVQRRRCARAGNLTRVQHLAVRNNGVLL